MTLKACLQVLRRVPRKAQRTEEDSEEQQTSLQFLLRGLIKLVPHPRDVQVHQATHIFSKVLYTLTFTW
jgi:hypothetical protein